MSLIAIPNVSEGRDAEKVRQLVHAIERRAARVLDVHSDESHNRSVITVSGEAGEIVSAMAALAAGCGYIDLEEHVGAHPRLGGLDVCPIVPHDAPMSEAISVARRTAEAILEATGLPIYFYGEAATRDEARDLASLRRGGLAQLIRRAEQGLEPDLGPSAIDPRRGVVCVGARDVLIAFNVWLECSEATVKKIAASVRESSGGIPGIRALGIPLRRSVAQVSMNLFAPERTGIDDAFDAVSQAARRSGVRVVATEIVGLVPERYLPSPDAQAARLLVKPGRSLESALKT